MGKKSSQFLVISKSKIPILIETVWHHNVQNVRDESMLTTSKQPCWRHWHHCQWLIDKRECRNRHMKRNVLIASSNFRRHRNSIGEVYEPSTLQMSCADSIATLLHTLIIRVWYSANVVDSAVKFQKFWWLSELRQILP